MSVELSPIDPEQPLFSPDEAVPVIPRWLQVGRAGEIDRTMRHLSIAEVEAIFFEDGAGTTESKWRTLIARVDNLVGMAFARGDLKRVYKPIEAAVPKSKQSLTPSITRDSTRPATASDPELSQTGVSRAKLGDYSRIADYYEELIRPGLTRTLIRRFVFLDFGDIATNTVAVEDVIQEVWVRLLEKPQLVDKLDDYEALTKWCYKVAINIAYDHARKIKNSPTRALEEMLEKERGPIGIRDIPEDELIERVKACILDLDTDQQQEVAVLKLIYLMSEANIALVLGSNTGAIKTCRHRMMASLQSRLKEIAFEYVEDNVRSKKNAYKHREKLQDSSHVE